MSDFKAKMHQTQFRRWGAYSAPPDPLAGFKGPTSKGREGREGKGGERGGVWDGRKGTEKEGKGERRGEGERERVGREGEDKERGGKGMGNGRRCGGARKVVCPGAHAGLLAVSYTCKGRDTVPLTITKSPRQTVWF